MISSTDNMCSEENKWTGFKKKNSWASFRQGTKGRSFAVFKA